MRILTVLLALAFAAVGFAAAAPDCLDGSRGCGPRPLAYTAAGAALGAGVGWALRRTAGR